jgi:hypothetical protein
MLTLETEKRTLYYFIHNRKLFLINQQDKKFYAHRICLKKSILTKKVVFCTVEICKTCVPTRKVCIDKLRNGTTNGCHTTKKCNKCKTKNTNKTILSLLAWFKDKPLIVDGKKITCIELVDDDIDYAKIPDIDLKSILSKMTIDSVSIRQYLTSVMLELYPTRIRTKDDVDEIGKIDAMEKIIVRIADCMDDIDITRTELKWYLSKMHDDRQNGSFPTLFTSDGVPMGQN